ncbi:MAG: ATP-binding protein, partial [Thermodesulfobacteriota bacterium]|nr:ATP-binding protein [Thermodesulfobacteriota bacterium]
RDRDRVTLGPPVPVSDALADYLGGKLGMRITLMAPDGRVIGDSGVPTKDVGRLENHAGRPEFVQALAGGHGWSLRRSATLSLDLLYVAGLLGRPEKPELVIRLALSLAEVEQTLARLRRLILLASLLGVALSLGVAFLVARIISRPVKDLTVMVRDISSGDLTRRMRRYSKHEIGDLGQAFDQMADHLQQEIEAVTEARDRLETILRGMTEGVLVTGSTGRITLTNQAFRELFNLDVNPLGRRPSEIIRNAGLIEALQRVSPDNPHASLEIRVLGPTPRALQVEVVALPNETSGSGLVAVFHDISEQKRVEEMRRDFVANVSHELRTPIAAIRASVETLLDGALDDSKFSRRFIEIAGRNAVRIEAIVFDLLKLARLESGKAEMEKQEVKAEVLAGNVLDAMSGPAASRRVTLAKELPDQPLLFSGNQRQLEQALVNLLDNAVKYTEPGGRVTLKIFRRDGMIHLAVSDTGLGIPPEHLNKIFERFYRVDNNRSRKMGGTGLGLAIVKHIAQAHDGGVEVESRPGRGSSFSLILPA